MSQTTCLTEPFTYPDGDLNGRGLWTGAAGKVVVLSNQVKMDFSTVGATTMAASYPLPSACTDCAITCSILIKRGSDSGNPNTATQGFQWRVSFTGLNGASTVNMGGFDGTGTTARGRVGEGSAGGSVNISDTTFTKLTAVIFPPPTKHTKFYIDNNPVPFVDLAWPGGIGNAPAVTGMYIQIIGTATPKTGLMFFDDVSIASGPCSCLSELDPPLNEYIGNFLAAALPGGTTYPSAYAFTLDNLSASTSINYTATESKADGSATDYPWLSLSPASGGVATLSNTAINATLTAPGTVGIYAGNIKVADDCSPADVHIRPLVLAVGSAPCVVEPFQYPSGDLTDVNQFIVKAGGWTGGSGTPSLMHIATDPDDPNNQVLKLDFVNNTGTTGVLPGVGCGPCEDGLITAIARLKGSAGVSAVSRSWQLDFRDSSNKPLATWQGTRDSVRGRTRGGAFNTAVASVNATSFHELKAVIDTISHKTTYYFDGVSLGADNPQSFGVDLDGQSIVGDTVNSIAITILGDNPTVDGSALLDDIQVYSCTGTCDGSVTPKRGYTQEPFALTGGATASGAPINFTISNDGLEPFSYSAQTVDSSGAPFTYPWLSLANASGGPLAPGTGDSSLTANIDTTELTKGAQFGFIKITDTCSPTRSYTRSIELNIDDCATQTFPFSNGDLAAQPGWFTNTPLAVPSPIQVVSGVVKLTGGTLTTNIDAQHLDYGNCPVCPDTDGVTAGKQGDDLVSIKVKIRGHTGGSALWELHITPLNTASDIASWTGSASTVTPFTLGGSGIAQTLTGGGVFDQLEARINFNSNTVDGIPGNSTRFYFNNTLVANLTGAPNGGRVRYVRFVQFANDFTADPDPVIEFDDLIISRCLPGCHDPVFDVRDNSNNVTADGKIDEHDLLVFEFCTGTSTGVSHGHSPTLIPNPNLGILECSCMDVNHDQRIDIEDFAVFQRCYTGTSGTIDPNCDN